MTAIVLSSLSFSTGTLALLCVCILWLADARPVQATPVQQPATFGSIFDVLHIEKCRSVRPPSSSGGRTGWDTRT
jgi:hypothetical protein